MIVSSPFRKIEKLFRQFETKIERKNVHAQQLRGFNSNVYCLLIIFYFLTGFLFKVEDDLGLFL